MYEVLYQPLMRELGEAQNPMTVNVSASDTSLDLMNLQALVNYTISVRAYTSVGEGPYSEVVMAITNEDSKYTIARYDVNMPDIWR